MEKELPECLIMIGKSCVEEISIGSTRHNVYMTLDKSNTSAIQNCFTDRLFNCSSSMSIGRNNFSPVYSKHQQRPHICGKSSSAEHATLDTSEPSFIFHDCFIDNLPYPFSSLDLRAVKSSSGQCWIFHMSNLGEMKGCKFPSGYRLFGLKEDNYQGGTFFMECRNFKKNVRCMVSAMIPNKKTELGCQLAYLTLSNGITYCSKTDDYLMHHHTWKSGRNYSDFRKQTKTKELIEEYFNLWDKTHLSKVTFVFLNELFTGSNNKNRSTPIQSSLVQPDVWTKQLQKDSFDPIRIRCMTRKQKSKMSKRKRIKTKSRNHNDASGSTRLYAVKHSKMIVEVKKNTCCYHTNLEASCCLFQLQNNNTMIW